MSVLIVATSCDDIGIGNGNKTGAWFEEIAGPYYVFLDAGMKVTIASPAGGRVPLDPGSLADNFMTESTRRFHADEAAMAALGASKELRGLDLSEYTMLYLAGGHGVYKDFNEGGGTKAAIEAFVSRGLVVGSDCHGPCCFNDCVKPDGSALVKGMKMTCFSDSEEAAVGMADAVPYLLQKRMTELGALVSVGADWTSNVVVDGKIVTGQNPQSSVDCAKAMIALVA